MWLPYCAAFLGPLARSASVPRRAVVAMASSPPLPPPRVVFTDCDGTLLDPAHALTPRARATLAALDRLGVRVVPATGRANAGAWTAEVRIRACPPMRRLLRRANPDATFPSNDCCAQVLSDPRLRGGRPGIYLNGCAVYDADGPLATTTLDARVVGPVLEFCRKRSHEGLTAVVYTARDEVRGRRDPPFSLAVALFSPSLSLALARSLLSLPRARSRHS
jgi:hypothetical protein